MASEFHRTMEQAEAIMRPLIEQLQQQNAAMRALLQDVGRDELLVWQGDVGLACAFCKGTSISFGGVVFHHDSCLWLKIRAFLAEYPKLKEARDDG